MLETTLINDTATVRIADLGAKVLNWSVGKEELLWPSDGSLTQGFAGGGIPFLFPFAGRTWHEGVEGYYQWQSFSASMPLHGFAHRQYFDITKISSSEAIFHLRANQDTYAYFPWDFELDLSYRLNPDALHWSIRVLNLEPLKPSVSSMPLSMGLHPYFAIKGSISSVLSHAQVFHPVSPEGKALDLKPLNDRFYEHQESRILVQEAPNNSHLFTEGYEIKIESDPQWKYLVMYSKDAAKYLAIEPWMNLPDAVHRPDIYQLKTGESITQSGSFSVNFI